MARTSNRSQALIPDAMLRCIIIRLSALGFSYQIRQLDELCGIRASEATIRKVLAPAFNSGLLERNSFLTPTFAAPTWKSFRLAVDEAARTDPRKEIQDARDCELRFGLAQRGASRLASALFRSAVSFKAGADAEEAWQAGLADLSPSDWDLAFYSPVPALEWICAFINDEALDWMPLLERLPDGIRDMVWEKAEERLAKAGVWRLSTREAAYIASRIQDDSKRCEFEDRHLFYARFMKTGEPEKCLAEMHEGTLGHVMASVVKILSDGGDPASAVALMKKKLARTRAKTFDDAVANWLYGAALYRDRTSSDSLKTLEYFAKGVKIWKNASTISLKLLGQLALMEEPYPDPQSLAHSWWVVDHDDWLGGALYALTAMNFKLLKDWPQDEGWGELIDRTSLGAVVHQGASKRTDLPDFEGAFGFRSPLPPYVEVPEWERVLERLMSLSRRAPKSQTSASAEGPTERIAYYVDLSGRALTMRLQKALKGGASWTKGTELSPAAVMKGLDIMTPIDRAVAAAMAPDRSYANRAHVDFPKALFALIGSPSVYSSENPDERLEVVNEPLQITATQAKDGTFVVKHNLSPRFNPAEGERICVRPAPGSRILVTRLSDAEAEVIAEFSRVEAFPKEAKEKLSGCLETLSQSTTVISDLLQNAENLARMKGSSAVTVRIFPIDKGEGYLVEVLVRPTPDSAVTCRPGMGSDFIALKVKGIPAQVERDRAAEEQNFEAFEAAMERLGEYRDGDYEWTLSPEACLEMLEIVRELGEKRAVVEWPEGVKLSVTKAKLSADQLQLSLRRLGQWFELEGKVQLDEKAAITVAELLEKIRNARGNFIQLSETEYLSLTDALKKQLGRLDQLSGRSRRKGEGVRVSVFNAGALEEIESEGLPFKADQDFRDLAARIKAADAMTPKVPAGLKAELRDYQVEGFEWMSRLTSWGAGALLADDMGLGKTLQTIALLLSRKAAGPALVVVPTAVLFNWVDELKRFAPGLKPMIFNTGNRKSVAASAKAGDVVLATYGVLAGEIDILRTREWATVVLDEAHTIKNRDTKTSKAAMALRAQARVMLTGTPLQNHLAEIWNLFEFINPGLLGDYAEFSERFIVPIEKNRSRDQQRLLKRLVAPFILRRTKAEVLDELPEKTEITLHVNLSAEERVLYESLRSTAQENLESGAINPIEAIAELVKLRQAACNPLLVDKTLKIPSSKARAFIELAEELIGSGHRALVFSQFTSHLALIKSELDRKEIPYLYLDGSMTASQRLKLVDDFQSGEMPLFLISLKAGGTGLNLTAADYVIHLDPWWNPAIEDQASDRAYRIGQENPVTIYRLIAENTIEEKILKLHETKKSLADALLEGADMSSRLSKEEILKLLSEG